VRLRPASQTEEDVRVLREMLAWAAGWRHAELNEGLLLNPTIALYLEEWGRPGDAGAIAESENAKPLGAAWYRQFAKNQHGYGFISPEIPELSVGVAPEHRGRGIGTALLEALVERAQQEGAPALSLSVEEDNPALRLYERLGFRRVARTGNALTLRRDLR
jgi:ribosomal protein S18 acetylase RimI-like enzyme